MLFKSEGPVPTEGELAEHLRRFLTEERPRRQRLWDYYLGEQGVPKGRVVPGRPNNHLTSNYAKYITDVQTGYFMGVPPTFSFQGKRVQKRMTRALADASLGTRLYDAARDMSVCGEGFLTVWPAEDGLRLARLDPCETFAVTSGILGAETAAVRVRPLRDGGAEGELYLPGCRRALTYDGRAVTLGPPQPLPLRGLCVSRFCNNLPLRGDFEPVLSLLDAYNLLLSGAMDDMQSVANAFLALYGMLGTSREDIERANLTRVLTLSENGRAEFVVKNLNPAALELLQKTLVDDLLLLTMTPNLNDRSFAGNSSGVALEYKLWGAEQARAAKERGFSGGLYHLIALFYEGLNLLGGAVGGPCTARFYKNLPQDLTALCANLSALGDTISRRTRLELLPFVSDPDEELNRLEEERQHG